MTMSRKMVVATLRWMRMPEEEVRVVEGMYKGTKGRVLVGPGMPEEFSMNIGLRQGKHSQPNHVYHDDGAGKQEGELEG